MPTKHDILKEYWGFDTFRPNQENIIDDILNNNDVLGVLPTGAGKSLCFQIPALLKEGITIVISPLIALMKDQVEHLAKRHVNAAAIYSGMNIREIEYTLDNCTFGNTKLLYISPERIGTKNFQEKLKQMKVNLFVIDEAHCISQWGYDFRPSYLNIKEIRALMPNIPMVALTATATPKVKEDIIDKLGLQDAQVHQGSFARENLSYTVRYAEDKNTKLVEVINKIKGSGIIYAQSRKKTEEIAKFLRANKINADFYHAGLSNEGRSQKQTAWQNNQIRIIVATNAFGMGIDKADVRIVIHMNIPNCMEAYYQEAGRGGRDGGKAYGLIIYNETDFDELRKLHNDSSPSISFLKEVYQAIANNYKIAIGSGFLASYNFDLNYFARKYKFEVKELYHAIQKLEQQGLIQLNEAFHNPSMIRVNADKSEFYTFQIANKFYDPIIKALLRLYGGNIFAGLYRISEKKIANLLNIPVKDVFTLLEKLHQTNMIFYDKQKDKSQLVFTTPRHDADSLPIDFRGIENKQKLDKEKMEFMISFTQHQTRCRTQLILDYFGEESYQNCDICDICVGKKKEQVDIHSFNYREKILESLQSQDLSLKDITKLIKPEKAEILFAVIRELVDNQEISYDDAGQLRLKK